MTKTTAVLAAALLALASPVLADNPTNAKSMASALKGGGGGNNSPLKEALGLEGNGGVASFVSGGGNGGWGNIGSTLTGGQVSSRPAKE
ncbi:hypothetical protein E7811_02520 [Aliigemmobacter aestuarii]|uniref:Uncharacterized protein n=1 Tax=Aliigemmobacter aestuarii TaxID=1445661 RepID=A0A4S3MT24_9RHOB|nr:hypothetical protein [Gemmobacter aestuarii]THD84631.1 hypothetical protein E7811_02520 [Gemmobacter aestuarii]